MQRDNGYSVAGLVLGVIGFILSWIPIAGILFGSVLGALAIIFSAIGIGVSEQRGDVGRETAIAGLVLGGITVVFKMIPIFNLL